MVWECRNWKFFAEENDPIPFVYWLTCFESRHPLLTGDDSDEATASTTWVTALSAHYTSDAAVCVAQLQILGTTECIDFIPELKLWVDPEPSPEVAQNIDTSTKQHTPSYCSVVAGLGDCCKGKGNDWKCLWQCIGRSIACPMKSLARSCYKSCSKIIENLAKHLARLVLILQSWM